MRARGEVPEGPGFQPAIIGLRNFGALLNYAILNRLVCPLQICMNKFQPVGAS